MKIVIIIDRHSGVGELIYLYIAVFSMLKLHEYEFELDLKLNLFNRRSFCFETWSPLNVAGGAGDIL